MEKHREGFRARCVTIRAQARERLLAIHFADADAIGPLGETLLEAVWARGDGTVRELLNHQKLRMAYTTAMTTLTRLYEKQLLTRTVEGRAFRYKPRFTKVEMQRAEAEQLIRQLLRSATTVTLPLSYLVEAVTEHDVRLLDDLQQLVEQKRRQLGKRE